MKRKINLRMSMLALLACVLTFCATLVVSYQTARTRMETETARQAALVAAGLEEIKGLDDAMRQEYLVAVGKSDRSRVTLIRSDGTVIFDSNHAAARMENHLSRPEVQQALRSGAGASMRTSETLGSQTYYAAVRLSTGEIVRLSNTIDLVAHDLQRAIPALVFIIAGVCGLSMWLAHRLTVRLVAPIHTLNLNELLESNIYEELSPLLGKIRTQNEQIQQQMELLRRRQVESEAVMNNMSEGLVVLDDRLRILSANSAAVKMLGAEGRDWTGENLLALSRDTALYKKARTAAAGKKTSLACAGRDGAHLQLYFSPVDSEGVPRGCVVLIVDASGRYAAERSRREFTANVSHELKTPLTSISGYAEMLSLGLVKEEDVRSFAEKIHSEAIHLITLVDDIIKLSRLDESMPSALPFEPVELYALSGEVMERLRGRAAEHRVTLTCEGAPVTVHGVRQMLGEAIFNLCDNAIKYGRAGGRVTVAVHHAPAGAQLIVSDDGIGIAPADQERIFERFYRADKSHSRAVDGTGLGLAIVKHICELHGGTVRIESAPGEGSRFILTFPLIPKAGLPAGE